MRAAVSQMSSDIIFPVCRCSILLRSCCYFLLSLKSKFAKITEGFKCASAGETVIWDLHRWEK